MTAAEFRELALSLPEVVEGSHMGHADFRVGGKIFASLGYPEADHGMVILPAETQAELLAAYPIIFAKATGAWGAAGATNVRLATAGAEFVSDALASAWRKRAPRKFVAKLKHGS